MSSGVGGAMGASCQPFWPGRDERALNTKSNAMYAWAARMMQLSTDVKCARQSTENAVLSLCERASLE